VAQNTKNQIIAPGLIAANSRVTGLGAATADAPTDFLFHRSSWATTRKNQKMRAFIAQS
jgi:hypothetical protein